MIQFLAIAGFTRNYMIKFHEIYRGIKETQF